MLGLPLLRSLRCPPRSLFWPPPLRLGGVELRWLFWPPRLLDWPLRLLDWPPRLLDCPPRLLDWPPRLLDCPPDFVLEAEDRLLLVLVDERAEVVLR